MTKQKHVIWILLILDLTDGQTTHESNLIKQIGTARIVMGLIQFILIDTFLNGNCCFSIGQMMIRMDS